MARKRRLRKKYMSKAEKHAYLLQHREQHPSPLPRTVVTAVRNQQARDSWGPFRTPRTVSASYATPVERPGSNFGVEPGEAFKEGEALLGDDPR